jgi:hypothetical protein
MQGGLTTQQRLHLQARWRSFGFVKRRIAAEYRLAAGADHGATFILIAQRV